MTTLSRVIAELDTYSDSTVIEYSEKLGAAYVNINRAVISLYMKNKKVCVGINGPNKQDYCFENQSVNHIVERLREAFS